ncbi:MAG: hypothetical protein AB9907_10495 [Flexilinea sp.]
MTIPILLVGICVVSVIALNNLRPFTLKKLMISSRLETWLTLLICIVLVASIFLLISFLIFGLISWIPAGTAESIWLSATVLMLFFGILGVLLLREKPKGNLSMVCFLLGYLSLFFLVMGNFIEVST